PNIVPFWFLQELKSRGIHAIEVHHTDDPWIINSIAVAPGRLIMPEGTSDATREALDRHGVSVVTVPFDAVCSGGGGIHCSTSPLVRDPV
ncbi:hypothetical protein KHP62_18880, partial [Rhodobacteraceae bacterium NNCM2]|nr:hypothetical protein [Coraliihabitans acroporae]